MQGGDYLAEIVSKIELSIVDDSYISFEASLGIEKLQLHRFSGEIS